MPRTPYRNKDVPRGIRNRTSGLCKKANTFHTHFPSHDIAVIIRPRNGKSKISGYLSCPELLSKIQDSEAVFLSPDNYKTVADCIKTKPSSPEDSSECSSPESTASGLSRQEYQPPLGSGPDVTDDASPSTASSPPSSTSPKPQVKPARKDPYHNFRIMNLRQRDAILAALSNII